MSIEQRTEPLTDDQLSRLEAEAGGISAFDTLLAEVRRLRGQLPEGMKHCTIVFKECEKGHGWLTATNWVQHGCPTCAVAAERERAARLLEESIRNWPDNPHIRALLRSHAAAIRNEPGQ